MVGLYSYDSLRADRHFQALSERAPEPWRTFGIYGLARRYVIGNRYFAADTLLTRALDHLDAANDARLAEEIPLSLAQVRIRTRGASAGRALLDSLQQTLPLRAAESRARYHCVRAEIATVEGRPGTEHAMRGIRAATEADDLRMRAYCGTVLGGILVGAGRPDSARAVFSGVVDDARSVGDPGWQAIGLQWRGFLDRSTGRFGLAAEDLEAAVGRAEEAGVVGVRNWALLNLALLHVELGDARAGLRYTRRALDGFGDEGDLLQVGSLRQVEARMLLRSGAPEASLEAFQALTRDAEAVGYRDLIVGARTGAAYAAVRAGASDIAREQVERLMEESIGGAGGPTVATVRYTALAVAMALGDRAAAARQLAWAESALAADEHFWRYHFRMRAAELAATDGELDRAVSLADEALDALERMRAELGPREMRLRAFQRSEDLADPDLGFATVIATLAEAGRTAAAFRLSERSRAGELLRELLRADALADAARPRDGVATPPVPTLTTVQAALEDGTTLVSFITGEGDEPTTALLVDPTESATVRIPPSDSLRAAIDRLHDLWSRGLPAEAPANGLSTRLLDPVSTHPIVEGASKLVIVPHGALFQVPWSALRLPDGRYLAERWSVTVAPSAGVALELWRRPERSGATEALVLADAPARGDLPSLPSARAEARRVAGFADEAVVRQGAEAAEAWVKGAELDRYRVVHAATHAITDYAGLSAGLVLAPGDGEDGLLKPGEAAALSLDADLVVLSACHTASGRVLRGEGLRGLVAPILEAGGRAVIATRWRVADRAATRFVTDIYDGLADDRTVADALALARRRAIEADEPVAHWAAFTVIGDGAARVPLNRPTNPLVAVLVALSAAAAVGWHVRARMRKPPHRRVGIANLP
ncbi:MAG: CHAT domain-containing protein [Gemmatimonadota bacterium]|nr:CHAT domain-containing protein [Gemmatimonadota bacterium]